MRYYLAGPFWDKDCTKFFDDFVKRCNETKMTNNGEIPYYSSVERMISNYDEVFIPGHFKVDFNKIKSEYDSSSFRRVLRQVLSLDIDELGECEGLVVYPKGYDLGTMFELGYFLSRNSGGGTFMAYNELRKRLIVKDPDEELIKCIDKLISMSFWKELNRCYQPELDELNPDKVRVVISEGSSVLTRDFFGFLGSDYNFNLVALNVDNYMESPFNSMLAGFLYGLSIPFITYSSKDLDSNVMMLASSLAHVKIDSTKTNSLELVSEIESMNLSKLFWDNSHFDKFKDIK